MVEGVKRWRLLAALKKRPGGELHLFCGCLGSGGIGHESDRKRGMKGDKEDSRMKVAAEKINEQVYAK